MAEPLDYQPQRPPLPNRRRWGFAGCLTGLALFAIAFVERLSGSGSRDLTMLLLPYTWLLALAGLPFLLTIVLAVIQLPLEGGIIGFLLERRRPILVSCVIAAHLAAAVILMHR
ncbi:MAG: hypothetical protein H7144_01330 [Burkholderiales bacterium]|nr:hypothetical protein [Phycisphaerae bacterium]